MYFLWWLNLYISYRVILNLLVPTLLTINRFSLFISYCNLTCVFLTGMYLAFWPLITLYSHCINDKDCHNDDGIFLIYPIGHWWCHIPALLTMKQFCLCISFGDWTCIFLIGMYLAHWKLMRSYSCPIYRTPFLIEI